MPARFIIEGIQDFRELPRELADAAKPITHAAAERATAQVRAAYPLGKTGGLKAGVGMNEALSISEAAVAYDVTSSAIYAGAYEYGSKQHNQRARPTFWPIVNRERTAATRAVIAMVKAAGFTVTGDNG